MDVASFPLWKQQLHFNRVTLKSTVYMQPLHTHEVILWSFYIMTCRIITNSNLHSKVLGKWENIVRLALSIEISKTAADGYIYTMVHKNVAVNICQ